MEHSDLRAEIIFQDAQPLRRIWAVKPRHEPRRFTKGATSFHHLVNDCAAERFVFQFAFVAALHRSVVEPVDQLVKLLKVIAHASLAKLQLALDAADPFDVAKLGTRQDGEYLPDPVECDVLDRCGIERR